MPRNRHGRSKTSRSSSSLLHAWTYSHLANELQPITAKFVPTSSKAGHPIGLHDMMIGGHARSEGLILVSNNLREFQRIEGLRVDNWVYEPR